MSGPVRRPRLARRSSALDLELDNRLRRLDIAARAAILTILEIVGDSDRARATQLIEAMATVIAFATRSSPGKPQ